MPSDRREDDGRTWCRHRTPFTSEFKTCKARVDFHQFGVPGTRSFENLDAMPCIGLTPETRARCPYYASWTVEELAERDRRIATKLAEITLKHGGRDYSGDLLEKKDNSRG